jgi:dTDP-glucose pyrophosphorylase
MQLNIVVTMAGHGKRFVDAGFNQPKPIIELHGKPMFLWALESLPIKNASVLTLAVSTEHAAGVNFELLVQEQYPGSKIKIVRIDHVTRGQSETAMMACADLDPNLPLLIYNCDSYFDSQIDWRALIESDIEGALVCFKDNDPRYSFARVGENGFVDLVTEKDPVSDNASTGAYYFKRTSRFCELAHKRIEKGVTVRGEYFIAPIYNDLIERNEKVIVLNCKRFVCFGTPEEYRKACLNPLT